MEKRSGTENNEVNNNDNETRATIINEYYNTTIIYNII
jgi:hypothetical protein